LSMSGQASCADVRMIASHHLATIRAKLAELAGLEAILSETVARCAGDATPVCPVLDILDTDRGA
jgi:MerR family transcriptional regulator, mercuric resistance operon regulatory protein